MSIKMAPVYKIVCLCQPGKCVVLFQVSRSDFKCKQSFVVDDHYDVFLSSDYELSVGMNVVLASQNHPSYYPPDSYVLWTFQHAIGVDPTGVVYHISYGFVHLGYFTTLIIGAGWDPDNATDIHDSITGYYEGFPQDLSVDAGDMFVEFDYGFHSIWLTGFQLQLTVQDASGKNNDKTPLVRTVICNKHPTTTRTTTGE